MSDNTSITLERAQPEDAAALVRVQVAAFHHDSAIYPGVEPGGPPGYDSVAAMQDKIACDECYKILRNGEIVGGVVVFQREAGHSHLDVLFIAPEYHGQGIGTQAMQWIEQAHPTRLWTLDTPKYATRNHHFYEKFGYRKTGEHEIEGDSVVLFAYEKRL